MDYLRRKGACVFAPLHFLRFPNTTPEWRCECGVRRFLVRCMGRGCHGVQAVVGEDDGRLGWVRVWCVAAVDARHHAWEFAKGTVTRGLAKEDDVGVDVGSSVHDKLEGRTNARIILLARRGKRLTVRDAVLAQCGDGEGAAWGRCPDDFRCRVCLGV